MKNSTFLQLAAIILTAIWMPVMIFTDKSTLQLALLLMSWVAAISSVACQAAEEKVK